MGLNDDGWRGRPGGSFALPHATHTSLNLLEPVMSETKAQEAYHSEPGLKRLDQANFENNGEGRKESDQWPCCGVDILSAEKSN